MSHLIDLFQTMNQCFVLGFQVQAHGTDAMVESSNCLFFLPHRPSPQAQIRHPPVFLFMKGTGTMCTSNLTAVCGEHPAIKDLFHQLVSSILGHICLQGQADARVWDLLCMHEILWRMLPELMICFILHEVIKQIHGAVTFSLGLNSASFMSSMED
jgi:hypothetical protein